MLRMGMNGKSSQTYQQIALKHDISRERVRGIVDELKKTGQKPIYRLRLDPLIEQAERIVRLLGGKVAFSELITHLLNHGPQGELLKHAVPFIEYLNGFPLWQKAGMNIKDGLVNNFQNMQDDELYNKQVWLYDDSQLTAITTFQELLKYVDYMDLGRIYDNIDNERKARYAYTVDYMAEVVTFIVVLNCIIQINSDIKNGY